MLDKLTGIQLTVYFYIRETHSYMFLMFYKIRDLQVTSYLRSYDFVIENQEVAIKYVMTKSNTEAIKLLESSINIL